MPDFPRLTSRVLATLLLGAATAVLAQQPVPNPAVRHLIGLENIKRNATGKLSVQNSALEFKDKKMDVHVPVSDIDDIFTGSEIGQSGGRTGQLAKVAAPYGSGRVLSLLLRNKVDILTVSYHSADGGVHGAIFVLPKGQASRVREELIHAGAHASPALAPEVQEGGKP